MHEQLESDQMLKALMFGLDTGFNVCPATDAGSSPA
jgi:hypothetical protein